MEGDDIILEFGMAVGPGDRFVLFDKIGVGGMGEVWRAGDKELCEDGSPQVVALKFLSPSVRKDSQSLALLRTEVLQSQRLSHPNIVRIFDLHLHKGMPFIKMEYVEGCSLQRWLDMEPSGVMSWNMAAELTLQLVGALEYAHSTEKIVHRDLKPANLLLRADKVLKLSDFGISVGIHAPTSDNPGSGLGGTPSYASPQQLAGERPCPEDDIYALGSTLYELLTGSVPFTADSWEELKQKVTNEPPQNIVDRLSALGRQNSIPPKMLMLVERCLDKNALARPKTHELARRLSTLPAPINITRTPSNPDSERQWVAPTIPPSRGRSWLRLWFIMVLVAVGWWQKEWIQMKLGLPAHEQIPTGSVNDLKPPSAVGAGETPDKLQADETRGYDGGSDPGRKKPSETRGCVVIGVKPGPPAKGPFRFHVLDANHRRVPDFEDDHRVADLQINRVVLTNGDYFVVAADSETPPWEVEKEVSVRQGGTNYIWLVFGFGDVTVVTSPSGAKVTWPAGMASDPTATSDVAPFTRDFKSGRIPFLVSKRCYFPCQVNYLFNPLRSDRTNQELRVTLRQTRAPIGHEMLWTNSLNMIFRWVNANCLACTTETRVGEFRKFVAQTRYDAKPNMYAFTAAGRVKGQGDYSWENPGPGFEQTDDHPVVGVSWDDALAFCLWLTRTERARPDKYLEDDMSYRLPTTNEWFQLAGNAMYPWGDDAGTIIGNYAGTEVADSSWPACWPFLANHTDRFPRTAPAISPEFKANDHGFFHVGGNAAEWCGRSRGEAVLCGGSWYDGEWEDEHNNLEALQTRVTRREGSDVRDARNGFRVVIFTPE